MWKLECEESWAPKNWCFWTVVLEKILESPLDCKEIQQVHPKGDQSWVFIGRTDVEAETPILWPPHAKSWLIGKDSDAGRDWGQEEKGMTEDEMVGWHHQLKGHEFEWTLGVGDGQGGLACCDSCGRRESDTTERLNWAELKANSRKEKGWLYYIDIIFINFFPLCIYWFQDAGEAEGRIDASRIHPASWLPRGCWLAPRHLCTSTYTIHPHLKSG